MTQIPFLQEKTGDINPSFSGVKSVIKSIQTVTITIGASATSATATINAVDTTQAITVNQGSYTGASTTYAKLGSPRVELTNSTTVTASRGAQDGATTLTVTVSILEFVSGTIKNLYRGSVALSTSYGSFTFGGSVTSMSNAFVNFLGHTTVSSTTPVNAPFGYDVVYLSNTSTIYGSFGSGDGSFGYEVIEFNTPYVASCYPGSSSALSASIPANVSSYTILANSLVCPTTSSGGFSSYFGTEGEDNDLVLWQPIYNSGGQALYNERIVPVSYSKLGIGLQRGYYAYGQVSCTLYFNLIQFAPGTIKRKVLGRINLNYTQNSNVGGTIIGAAINAAKTIIIPQGFMADSNENTGANYQDYAKHTVTYTYAGSNQVQVTRGVNAAGGNMAPHYLLIEFN